MKPVEGERASYQANQHSQKNKKPPLHTQIYTHISPSSDLTFMIYFSKIS